MASFQSHPRRRPQKVCGSSMAPPSLNTANLRKSGTFHSPTHLSTDLVDPVARYCSMPKRSETNPQSLEQILIDAGEARVAGLLASVDNVLSGKTSSASDASILKDNRVLPVPSFMLDNHAVADPDAMDVDPKPKRVVAHHRHASDSGLGSSASGSLYDAYSATRSVRSSATTTRSAVTKSYSGLPNDEDKVRGLSELAIKQIQNRIVKPILQEASLREFHPLIKDVPRRIGDKDIVNLRDLEKTLIFLAPDYAASPANYLRFCETSVTFIASTVGCLCEADQRLPTDRPYTNNYFLDLVEQIRRYAAIMAATRERDASGEVLDEMDYSSDEKLTLRGGLSHDGKPVELVRQKNGKVIPIATEAERAAAVTFKRPLEEDDEMDEDSVHRSMARRRKSDRPGDVMHICADCKKEFKRPCDLTKHEKTHSRPWKCTDAKCKYHKLGWPTEKERDRHVNDKHTTAPPQYKCLFAPCTYASKRESNCKQHMEKAHGWTYVRSKANGKGDNKKASISSDSLTPSTPFTSSMATPASAPMHRLSTPMTPFDNSPAMHPYGDFEFENHYGYSNASLFTNNYQDSFRRESITTAGTEMTYSSSHSPVQPTAFEDAITPPDTDFNHAADMVFDPTFAFDPSIQQPTPALSNDDVFADHFQPLPLDNDNLNINGFGGNNTHLSSGAQPDLTLFSGNMQIDEGFGGDDFMPPSGDFQLFDSATASNSMSTTNNGEGSSNWFQDLSNFGGQFDNFCPPNTFEDMSTFDFGQ